MKFFSFASSADTVGDNAPYEWAEFNLPAEFDALAAGGSSADCLEDEVPLSPSRHTPYDE